MANLNKLLENKNAKQKIAPLIFNLQKKADKIKLGNIFTVHPEMIISDFFTEQLEELFITQNPSLIHNKKFADSETKKYISSLTKKVPLQNLGRWVYFPWINTLSHILEEQDFFLVRTSRNNYLITQEEQKKFYNARIGIGGLSIGSSVAVALVLQGGSKHIKLADFDTLALSNTNRVRAGIQNLGLLKTEITARQIYEINQYAKVEIFSDGVTEKNIDKFLKDIDVLVDEMDSLAIKLLLRSKAKKMKLPIVMGADNGNSAVVDIERHDLQKSLKFFHNRLGKINYKDLKKLNKFGTGRLIAKLIGPENHDERMLKSLTEMGKTIASWPQLGGTALLNGAAVAYCVRKIVTGQPLEDNRAIISFDDAFRPAYTSKTAIKKQNIVTKSFKKIFNI